MLPGGSTELLTMKGQLGVDQKEKIAFATLLSNIYSPLG